MKYNSEIAYQRLINKEYRKYRSDIVVSIDDLIQDKNLPLALRISGRLKRMVENETPVVFKEDNIGFVRTIKKIPFPLSDKEHEEFSKDNYVFDEGGVGNISSDYSYTLNNGFDYRLKEIQEQYPLCKTEEEKVELIAMEESVLAMYELVDKYQKEAQRVGNEILANILLKVPYNKPQNYHEALVFFRIMNYTLWLNYNKHNTLGRFDQYMYPFYINDIQKGILTYEEAKELTKEFFISLNVDADLYHGVQQGDNGQSIVLGGVDKEGNDAFNELSKLCLEASLELKIIDPKINLRVNKKTDDKWYDLGTQLTKQGLGFPQYNNDDIIIPALVRLGYDLEDARDYVVAACWEFIIPGLGMEVPNIEGLNIPLVVQKAFNRVDVDSDITYDDFLILYEEELEKEVKRLVDRTKNFYQVPTPYQSLLMKGCLEKHKDVAEGCKYNNFGFHGVGVSTAADSIAALKLHIFDKKDITLKEMKEALDNNFEGYETLRKKLLSSPKMGDNDDYVDNIACYLLEKFSIEVSKYKNARNGIYRAGTGSAMYYIWYAEEVGASMDGRKKGEYFGANYSPSLNHNFKGVLSVIKSFTKPDLTLTCNGGPLTLEFHDTLFRNEDGVKKVANLVKTFVYLGGHQLQLNAVNKEKLLDAQKHPENYKNLIVRVWGWSGYFNELDLVYQNHIIKRLEFTN